MSNAVLVPGSLFAGRYLVEKCIAEGGMGAVYEVVHAQTSRRHALKVMHAHTLGSADLRERFRQEARVAANIQSEFIVDVLDAGVDAPTDLPFLVMELLHGDELGDLLEKRGRFSPSEAVTFLGQVAMALDKTHRAMIVHRDLKPENLFLTYRDDGSPRVKVLDFGVAKIVAESNTNAAATRSVGTPLYMAPEQFQPGNKVAPATDLYSLALIAYTFLVGRSYWAEEAENCSNVFAFAATATRGPLEPASVRAQRAGVALPPAFDAWFTHAAHADPAMRFPRASAMIRALSDAIGVPFPFATPGSDPLAGSGASPAVQYAAASSGQFPASPSGQFPASPSGQFPASPSGQFPASPSAQYPASPSAQYPASPSGQFPAAASARYPAASSGQFPASSSGQLPPASTAAFPSGAALSQNALGASGVPIQAGFSASNAPAGDLSRSAGGAPPRGSNKVLFAGIGVALVAGVVVALAFFLPRGNPTGGVAGAGIGSSASAPDLPVADPPATTLPTAEPPSVTPTGQPSATPSATASASPSAAPSAEPSALKGPVPKPTGKTPKPPGTSVYIRD